MAAVPDTLRVHVEDTLSVIKQTFDDRSVSRAQVAYSYILVANDLLAKHIDKRRSGAFLTPFDNIPISVSANGRKFIELPSLIFDYDMDAAVDYLSYISDGGPGCPPRFTKTLFSRTSQSEARLWYMNPNTQPSPKNPYFYRAGQQIFLLGIESVSVKLLEAGLNVTVDPLQKIDIDQPFNFPQELLLTLKRQVIDLVRYNWFFPKDIANTGEDESQSSKVNNQKIVSVNPQPEDQ